MSHEKLKIILADSIKNIPDSALAVTSISADGKKIYAVYSGENISKAAELFENNNGKLTSVFTIPARYTSNEKYSIDDGYLNCDASKSTLLSTSLDTGIGLIKEYNMKTNRVSSAQLSNISIPLASLLGGTYSQDGRYTLVQYVLDNPTFPQTPFSSTLKILKSGTLEIVAEYSYPGLSNGAKWILNNSNKYFIALGFSNINPTIVDAEVQAIDFICPSQLQILEFNSLKKNISLIDEVSLPAFPSSIGTWPNCGDICTKKDSFSLIAVNTREAITLNQVLKNSSLKATSCLQNDGAELRLYHFDSENLCLVATIDHNERGSGVGFSPDAKYLAAIIRHIPTDGGEEPNSSMEIYKLPKNIKKYCEKVGNRVASCNELKHILETNLTPPISFTVNWSMDYQWLLVSGLSSTVTAGIQLYKVERYE